MLVKTILSLGILSLPFLTQAQALRCPPVDAAGNAQQKFEITAGAGMTLLYGDIHHKSNMGYGLVLRGDYKVYKGLYLGLEGQTGKLSAEGDRDFTAQSWDPRKVTNEMYFSGLINATVYPYRFFINERMLFRENGFKKYILNGLYLGLGVGGIFNNYKNVERESIYYFANPNGSSDPIVREFPEGALHGPTETVWSYDQNGNRVESETNVQRTKDILFPVVNVGLAVPLNKYRSYSNSGYFSAVINSEFNFSRGEDLDGYSPVGSEYNDMYNFTYLGIKYTF